LENPPFSSHATFIHFLLITKITFIVLLYTGSSNQIFSHIDFSIVSWTIYLNLQTGGNMGVTERKELYYSDIVNTLGWEDHQFQWSHAYKWYSTLSSEEKKYNKVWTSSISLVNFLSKVVDFK